MQKRAMEFSRGQGHGRSACRRYRQTMERTRSEKGGRISMFYISLNFLHLSMEWNGTGTQWMGIWFGMESVGVLGING